MGPEVDKLPFFGLPADTTGMCVLDELSIKLGLTFFFLNFLYVIV
jgi:hypothetical protein